ncbi:MAG: DNA mismatch repair protein MutL [Gammaproteobacteria bacterium]|jgi:DNA mismatch repair protein MutL
MIEKFLPPRITRLSGSLINQIAAGEVIERPSSVVKELIENAIDANASSIKIDIFGGGTEKIIISDNGYGIHSEDMGLAILRHSTSKLSSLKELATISSLGFRGEALSSIASVSDFCITSCTARGEIGSKLTFNPYTSDTELLPTAREMGTTVEVYKLFQPVPARRNFLRSVKTEFIHIQEIIKRFVLSRFDIDFRFYHNEKLILNCPKVESDYEMRISSIMGSSYYKNSWHIDSRIDDLHLWGWMGGASTARSQSDRQYLYLNNRIIKDKRINHAIRKVMNEIIPDARFPSYVLHIFIDPSSVDVNVHPTKQEVRFKSPRQIHDFIYAVLNQAARKLAHDQVGLKLEGSDSNNYTNRSVLAHESEVNIKDLKSLYEASVDNKSAGKVTAKPFGIPFAVLHNKFILTMHGNDIRIINFRSLKRHYLNERLCYELQVNNILQRPLLVPVMLSFNKNVISELMTYQKILDRLGLMLLQSGPQTISVRSIPSLIPELNINKLLVKITESIPVLKQNTEDVEQEFLKILVEIASSDENYQLSLNDIHDELSLMANLKLPYLNQKYGALWNTLSEIDLMNLVTE